MDRLKEVFNDSVIVFMIISVVIRFWVMIIMMSKIKFSVVILVIRRL